MLVECSVPNIVQNAIFLQLFHWNLCDNISLCSVRVLTHTILTLASPSERSSSLPPLEQERLVYTLGVCMYCSIEVHTGREGSGGVCWLQAEPPAAREIGVAR